MNLNITSNIPVNCTNALREKASFRRSADEARQHARVSAGAVEYPSIQKTATIGPPAGCDAMKIDGRNREAPADRARSAHVCPVAINGSCLWDPKSAACRDCGRATWLSSSCPACGQFGSVDLRTLARHPSAAISSLVPSVSCRRCSPNAPFAKLEMLTAERL